MTRPVHAYAWDWYDAAGNSGATVVPTRGNVSKTIRVYLHTNDPTEYAAVIGSAVTAASGAGNPRVALRLWQEIWVADEAEPVTPRFLWYNTADFSDADNWWFQPGIGPYVVPDPPQSTLDAWAEFGAAWRAQGITLDYLVGEEEQEIGYDGIRGIANRTAFFAPITVDDENNPYPDSPNPYLGVANLGSPDFGAIVGQFRTEYNAWGYFHKAAILRTMHGPIFSDDPIGAGADLPWSNYRDMPEGAVANRYAPPVYPSTSGSPEIPAGLTSPEEIANWTRWSNMVGDLNEVRRIATEGVDGWIDPWAPAPGYGADPDSAGATNSFGTWAAAVRQPWEKVLWRALMTHLMTMGIHTYIVWNAAPDPNRADNCVFMDAWFAGKTVGDENVRDNPQLDPDTDTITTTGNGATFTTTFAQLFQVETLYYTRAEAELEVAYLEGWPWSPTDPLVVSPGAAGDAEVAAMKAAIEANQGTTITTQEVEDDSMPPTQVNDFQVSTFNKATAQVLRGSTVRIGGTIEPLQGQPLGELVIKAQVRSRAKGTVIHDFAGAGPIPVVVDGDNRTFLAETDTDGWPAGVAVCDVFIIQDGTPYGVGRYAWDIVASVTEGVTT